MKRRSLDEFVARVADGTRGRDRVLDAAKAFALLAVICGHSLAWYATDDGRAINVLELRPGMWWITWGFQVLPLFFAAGAVSNFASREKNADKSSASGFLLSRRDRLVLPVAVYATVWSLILLPIAGLVPDPGFVEGVGRFLSQLLWFAAVYLAVVAAVPLTARWLGRPALVLGLWFGLILLVDWIRIGAGVGKWGLSSIGWVNLLLVWGWLHQVGAYLPKLQTRPSPVMLLAGLACVVAALGVAWIGPYSQSLITVAGDSEASNLAPPTVVVAIFGLGQILLLAGAWRVLGRLLADDRAWVVVALLGARGMGLYLWHIPVVAVCAGIALAIGWHPEPLSAAWWIGHLGAAMVAVSGAWVLAGLAGRAEWGLMSTGKASSNATPAAISALASALVILHLSVVGFATWWGAGALGVPGSAALLVPALWLLLRIGHGRRIGKHRPIGN